MKNSLLSSDLMEQKLPKQMQSFNFQTHNHSYMTPLHLLCLCVQKLSENALYDMLVNTSM